MKRVISALLSFLLLGCLTACDQGVGQSKNGNIQSGTLGAANGETHTDFDGVSIRILNLAEDEGKPQLNISWVNETPYEVVYGESYDVEREQNGKWTSCAINGELYFTAIGYELGRKATQTKTYNLSNSFDISENGKYRFVTDCSVYDKGCGGERTKCKLWAEFTVSGAGTQPTVVRESDGYSNIELSIPDGWKYETERMDDSGYCIAFWPEGYTGKIKMCYYTAFGVCGTGLESETVTVGKYEGSKGTYDSQKVWSFINFTDTPGFYVAINEGADEWWDRYGDEAMRILGTVKIADGIIDKTQAIEIAEKKITAKYDRTDAVFDSEQGIWTVSFYEKNRSENVQSITVSYNGDVVKEGAE